MESLNFHCLKVFIQQQILPFSPLLTSSLWCVGAMLSSGSIPDITSPPFISRYTFKKDQHTHAFFLPFPVFTQFSRKTLIHSEQSTQKSHTPFQHCMQFVDAACVCWRVGVCVLVNWVFWMISLIVSACRHIKSRLFNCSWFLTSL